ncbi:MAG: uroporphyrinogen decarboxylase family protein [Victivallaceae bacterium]|nr:uroporphyrinogen decarboxylase family protein [Victivallaceae bacterium]
MNNRMRVITSLNHEEPDKIPYHIWMHPLMQAKLSEYYGDPDFLAKLGNCFADIGKYSNNYREVEPNIWRDQFGVLWDRNIEKNMGIVCNQLVTESNIQDYVFPDPKVCLAETLSNKQILPQPDKFSFLQLGFSLFERAWTLAGMENIFVAMLVNEKFANNLFEQILHFNVAWIEEAVKLDIDAVFFGDDWGQQSGLLMSPELWRKFIKPRFSQMCRAVKAKGKYVFLHSCGNIQELFPDLIECGVDLFNPFQPEAMDIFRIKQQFGRHISFFGGISIQKTLPFGTVRQTKNEVKVLLETVGKDGGFIAGPSHSIPDARVENVAAMIGVLQKQ